MHKNAQICMLQFNSGGYAPHPMLGRGCNHTVSGLRRCTQVVRGLNRAPPNVC